MHDSKSGLSNKRWDRRNGLFLFMLVAVIVLFIPENKTFADYFDLKAGTERSGRIIEEDAVKSDGIYSIIESDEFRITLKTDRTEYHSGDAVILSAVYEYIGSKDEKEIKCCDPPFIFRVTGSNGLKGDLGVYYNKKSPNKKMFKKGEKYEVGFLIDRFGGFQGDSRQVFQDSDIEQYGENISVLHLPKGTYTFRAALSDELAKNKNVSFYAELHLNIDVKGEIFYSGNNIYRTKGKKEAVLIGTRYDGDRLDIPETVKYNGKEKKVTVIGDTGLKYRDYVDDYEYGDVYYGTFSGNTFTEISIPSTVEKISRAAFCDTTINSVTINAGQLVIAEKAFAMSGTIEDGMKLYITGGDVKIGKQAFWGSWLKEINISKSEKLVIGDEAFSSISNITKIKLPENTISIGDKAFFGSGERKNKTRLTIPKGTEIIGDAPANCLIIKIADGNTEFVVKDGLLLTADGNTVIGIADYRVKEIEVPEGVKKIRPQAFRSSRITKLVLPDSVTKIPKYMATYSGKLETVVLGKNVKEIGEYAFSGTKIGNIDLPKGLKTIGNRAFALTKLKKILIPKTVSSIGNKVLVGCRYINSVILEKNNQTYRQDGNLIYSPGTGTVIGVLSTEDIYSLPDTYVLSEKDAVKLDLSMTFYGNLYGLTIPENIKEIDISSFSSDIMGEYYGGDIDGKKTVYESAEIIFLSKEPPKFVDERNSKKEFFIWIFIPKDADREAYSKALEDAGLVKDINFLISDVPYGEWYTL